MAAATETMDLRKLIASKSLIVGVDKTLKELKKGTLSKVILASNCAEDTKETMKRYCKLAKIPCEELKDIDTEIGVICRKQFCISVAGVLKSK